MSTVGLHQNVCHLDSTSVLSSHLQELKGKILEKPFSQHVQSVLCCGTGTGRPTYLAEYVATSFLIKILPLPVFKVLRVMN